MSVNSADDLEKEIILMEQELILKRKLLDECREKLSLEISQHAQTKLAASKYMNENKELQLQLNVCLTGTQRLEEENMKNRESLIKLQVLYNAYLTEKQQISENCYKAEKENNSLRNEVAELKEQIKEHMSFLENYQERKSKTEALVSEIIEKQETLNKEQCQLEKICKEGLHFAEKLSEEAKFQIKYVQEAKREQMKTENKIIRMMAEITELKAEREKKDREQVKLENPNYLEMWKSIQREMILRNEELQKANTKLQEELSFSKEQIQMLMKDH